jgi:hypothetical protein
MKLETIILPIVFLLVLGCHKGKEITAPTEETKANNIVIRSKLTKQLATDFILKNKPGHTVYVMSVGGENAAGLRMAQSILENENEVKVMIICFSACAEYLLPAAHEVEFVSHPLIGFHWNSIMDLALLEQYGGDLSLCDTTNAEELQKILQSKFMDRGFWKETLEHLELQYYDVQPKESACPWSRRSFKNHVWLPTSVQLRDLWGLRFTGSVCADNFKDCTKVIDFRYKEGARVVIGDDVYISKGSPLNNEPISANIP